MTRAPVLALLAVIAMAAVQVHGAAAQPGVVGDRYGASAAPSAAPAAYAQPTYAQPTAASAVYGRTADSFRGRMLSWPGKSPALSPPAYATPEVVSPSPGARYATAAARMPPPGPPWSSRYAPGAGTVGAPQALPATEARGYRSYRTPPATSQPVAPQTYGPQSYAPSLQPAGQPALYAAGVRPDGWRPVYSAAPSTTQPALSGEPRRAAPRSIYASPDGYSPSAAADRAPPPLRTASADRRYGYDPTINHSVRFYSVHAPFGIRPDPAPIPPQFFTATADLSDPPGPLPTDHTTTASGTTRTARTTAAATDGAAQ